MEPTFRLAGSTDLDLLVEFMRAFNAIDAYPFDAQITRAALERFVSDPTLGRVWIIQAVAAPIGYLALTFGFSFEFHGRDAFIDELFVLASYRHQGVGTRAMQFVIEACHDLGVQALHLEVERHNSAAQALYRAFGFTDHDRYLLTRWIVAS